MFATREEERASLRIAIFDERSKWRGEDRRRSESKNREISAEFDIFFFIVSN